MYTPSYTLQFPKLITTSFVDNVKIISLSDYTTYRG